MLNIGLKFKLVIGGIARVDQAHVSFVNNEQELLDCVTLTSFDRLKFELIDCLIFFSWGLTEFVCRKCRNVELVSINEEEIVAHSNKQANNVLSTVLLNFVFDNKQN